MNVKPFFRSFAGGVIGPELLGRLELTKFQTGLAEAVNYWTLPHGPVQNRSGFGYVLEARDSTRKVRILPFSYNTEQTFILEFGHQYIRFHTQGATLVEAGLTVTAVTKANPGVLTYTGTDPSNGDWMYLAAIGGMTELNGRWVKVANVNAGANTFELTDIHGGANINTTGYTTYTSGGTASRAYTIASPYGEDDLFSIHFVQSADVLSLTHPTYAPRELRRLSATSWQLSTISFAPTIETPGQPLGTAVGAGGTPIDHVYKVTALAADGLEESLGSVASTAANIDLTVAGNYVEVDPVDAGAVTGAVRYNIYKLFNGLYGYIGQTDGSVFRDNNVTPDVSKTPPEANNPFSGAGDYPGAVGYAEGRRAFGGTNNKPQNYWLTRSGTESNLSYSIPTRDDDQIAQRILAREANRIRHIVTMADLIILTSGGEWRVSPQNSDILTPDSAAPRPIAAEGANDVQPVVTSKAIIYAQDQGGRVRDIKTTIFDTGVTYESNDISVMAPHLFDDYTVTDMTYIKAPNKMVFATRSDGVLLGLTYLPEHEVSAWHTHETDGLFESVAAVREGRETVLYAVVKRTINGRNVRYIERMASRRFASQEYAFFVDAGLTYDSTAADEISGLWHLEGEEVAVLADGAVHPRVTVTNGRITLEQEASVINIGLPITAQFKTLPVAFEAQGYGQDSKKNVSKVSMRVDNSSGLKAGPSYDKLKEYAQRTTEPYGSPPALVTGAITITLTPSWSNDGAVCVQQDDPLPSTILSMTLEVAVG